MDNNTRICFIVQRYGLEINGGAELLCRQMAEHLRTKCQSITVLTSKAIDHVSWQNEYDNDEDVINGIRVLRFPTTSTRIPRALSEVTSGFRTKRRQRKRELEWIKSQGPLVPSLIEYLRNHKEDYDVFIFSTYMFYPTVFGIPEVAEKAICMPNAHDEPDLRLSVYENVFLKPRAFLFNTEEERILVHSLYHNEAILSNIGGAGVEMPDHIDLESFKKKFGLNNYIAYVGRIEEGKNCGLLIKYFLQYKNRNDSDLQLVLIGKPVMDIPRNKDIISVGFVSEKEKFEGIAAAKALINPSKNESLSIVVLEAMSVETNVIVNGECSVLKGHCIKSNGALYYTNYLEFEGMLNYLQANPEQAKQLTKNALCYVHDNYQWDIIIDKLLQLIDQVITGVNSIPIRDHR